VGQASNSKAGTTGTSQIPDGAHDQLDLALCSLVLVRTAQSTTEKPPPPPTGMLALRGRCSAQAKEQEQE
jgi:hypothetical protein